MKKLIYIIILTVFIQNAALYAESVRIGTTYSPRQSEYLREDWKEVYLAILEMGFDIIRLGAYWNEIEKKEDIYSFESIDWQVKEAAKRNIPVILTVGMKAPRWPEYHIPDWVLKKTDLKFGQDVSRDGFLRERTLKFIKNTVMHYRKEGIVGYWQVENEPFDRSGSSYWWISPKFLQEEIALVRSVDGRKRPILINAATYPNRVLRFMARFFSPVDPINEALLLSDILGLNIYPTVGHKLWGIKLYFRTRFPERMTYFSEIIRQAKKDRKAVWITELQAEPWEPGEVVHKGKGQPITVRPEAIEPSFNELQKLGIKTVLLWGSEYWYFRKAYYKDETWWRKALDLIRKGES